MTPENFCYWLQGYIELSNCKSLTPEQTQMISNHLQLVFNPICKIKDETYKFEPFKKFEQDPTIMPTC